VSIRIRDGVFEVLSAWIHTLGGDDVYDKIINWLADEFKAEEDMDSRKDPMSLQR
jgi:molecular chaperone DnaK